jgi:Fe-S-cluster containining protein
MNISGRPVEAEITVPTAPTPPEQLLPLFHSIADLAVRIAVEDAEAGGESISCRKGCGACCRQLVPVSPIEARYLADHVRGLPEPRRAAVRERFREACRRLEEAGVLEKLRRPETFELEEVLSFGLDYFDLGIPCPFLEDESCSIHPDRPLICREFLVTSPAERCERPHEANIRKVELPGRVSNLVARKGEADPSELRPWVPLTLALEWDETHPDTTPLRPGTDWLEEFFVRMAVQPKGVADDAPEGETPSPASPDRER